MKIQKSEVSILEQEPGIEGLLKHIEKCGRIAYKSEDRITTDSYQRFLKMLTEKGHWAVFEHGTVYLAFPTCDWHRYSEFFKEPYCRVGIGEEIGYYYVTTNYRYILQNNLQAIMEKYWEEPGACHKHRISTHWICSRATSHQLVRSRIYSYIQESQRYCNYSKDKFERSITYILPEWIYRVREDIGSTIDSLTRESRSWILDLDGEELWDTLCCEDRTVASRDRIWKTLEDEYFYELSTDEGENLKPEEARGILPNDTKTELIMTGFLEDFYYTPPADSSEKAGFFYLRCAPDAQADIRKLAVSLKEQMDARGFDKLR